MTSSNTMDRKTNFVYKTIICNKKALIFSPVIWYLCVYINLLTK